MVMRQPQKLILFVVNHWLTTPWFAARRPTVEAALLRRIGIGVVLAFFRTVGPAGLRCVTGQSDEQHHHAVDHRSDHRADRRRNRSLCVRLRK